MVLALTDYFYSCTIKTNRPLMMTSALLRNKYSELVRAVTLVFVLLMLVAPALHHHHSACCADTAVQHCQNAFLPGIEPATSASTEDDCILCLWLTDASYTVTKPILFFFVSLSATALLLIFVRVTALCNAPQPRRIPRAPPVFCVA